MAAYAAGHNNDLNIVEIMHKPCFLPLSLLKGNDFFESLRLPLAKGSSTSNQAFLLRRKDVTALLGARNRYAIRLSDHQRSSTYFAGWDRQRITITANVLKT